MGRTGGDAEAAFNAPVGFDEGFGAGVALADFLEIADPGLGFEHAHRLAKHTGQVAFVVLAGVALFLIVPGFPVDAGSETEGIRVGIGPGIFVRHGQRASHAHIDTERAPAATAIIDHGPQTGISGLGIGNRHHVDGGVLADFLAGAAADALGKIVLVETAITVGRLASDRVLEGDRRLEEVFPRGIGGEDVAQGHFGLPLDFRRIGVERNQKRGDIGDVRARDQVL